MRYGKFYNFFAHLARKHLVETLNDDRSEFSTKNFSTSEKTSIYFDLNFMSGNRFMNLYATKW